MCDQSKAGNASAWSKVDRDSESATGMRQEGPVCTRIDWLVQLQEEFLLMENRDAEDPFTFVQQYSLRISHFTETSFLL
jgi:hypothetical protein